MSGNVVPFRRGNTVHEAELVSEDEQPLLVDQPPTGASPLPWESTEPVRRPIVAPWLTDRDQRGAAERWALGYVKHWGLFHSARSPIYGARVLLYAPRGVGRMLLGLLRWAADSETAGLRMNAEQRKDTAEYVKLDKLHNEHVRSRRAGLVLLVLALAGATTVTVMFAPAWAQALAAVAALGVCARAGRPMDRPFLDVAVIAPQSQRLTSEIVIRALGSLGISELTKAATKPGAYEIAFPAPITRDGPGWRADVELPYGVTATAVMEKRQELASGLRRPLGCVWPEPAPGEHPGRLVMWVGDQDMAKARQPRWPLLKTGTVDLFNPVPFGTDQRGRWVDVTLMFASMAIGAVPRVGKTFALRELLLIAALDPRAQLHCYDLKGTGDLSPLECVAHRYGVGDEDDEVEAGLADMRELQQELRRRTRVIRELPKDLCPENKVTPQLASKRSLGLHPIVIGVDECQRWFEHPEYGKEFEEIVTDLVKRGPALGMTAIVATQRPDAKSLPTGISDNVVLRYCLRVMGQMANDMVLGTSSYKAGIRATMFSQDDKGIGWLRGDDADARIVRTVAGLDAPAAEVVARRARVAREAAGRLSGYCTGETPVRAPAFSLLDDLQVVFAQAERLWSEDICTRLAELRPEVYGGWDPDALAAAVRPYALRTEQINMPGDDGVRRNRRGIHVEALLKAIGVRAERRQELAGE